MSTMNEKILDEQYQQFKLETSQVQNENFWIEQGINKNLIEKIQSYIQLGKLTSNDIDERVCEQLRTFPNDLTSIQSLFNEFDNSNLTGVVNKSAFLCNLIRQWKIQNPCEDKTSNVNTNSQSIENSNELIETNTEKHQSGPDQNKLKEILDRTGYKMDITAGQRKYGGPPPDGPDRPAANTEVFIGRIPREIFEDELIPLCEESGKIWDLRLMIDPVSGFNKGYCFVTYCSQTDSIKACERLNGYAIRPGKILKANGSVANIRLFIGNIPKTKTKDEIQSELSKIVEGITNVIVYTPADEMDKKKNRGFCFVDFDTHKNASAAKRKLGNARVRVFNRDIAVDWADPDEEPDDTIMSQVKVLYVRNITSDVTENDLKDLFLPYGNIERVRKVRDYAFVHFDKREDALNAMRALNGKTLGRNEMEISLAKPLNDKRKQAQLKREQRTQYDSSYHSRGGFNDNTQGRNNRSSSSGFNNQSQRMGGNMNRPDDSYNINPFGAFGGDGPSRGGGASNRGGRGGGFNSNNRGGGNNFNQNNRGGFNRPSQNNNFNGFNNQGGFGAFDGPPQNNTQFNQNGFNMNYMQQNQQFGGMKRSGNQMNDNNLLKRTRPDSGSWGSMNNDNSQQQNNWYQDQSYNNNNSQQQSNYSWN